MDDIIVSSKMFNFDKIMFLFVVLSYSFVVVTGNDIKDNGIGSEAHSDRGALWFGPRLGKRSLNLGEDKQVFYKLLEAADALKVYYDQLPYYEKQIDDPETRVTKKVIFTPKLGRSLDSPQSYENLDFTPRLGRRLSSDMPATPADQEMYRADPEQVDSRTKYFSPRLGRTMNFSPRLGRELVYESIYPDKVRIARSTNRTESQQ